MSRVKFPDTIDLTEEDLQRVLERVRASVAPPDYEVVERMAKSARLLSRLLEEKNLSIRCLRDAP